MATLLNLDDPRIADLVGEWVSRRDRQESVSPSDLTDDPDLIEALVAILDQIEEPLQMLGGASQPEAPASGVAARFEIADQPDGYPARGGMGVVYAARDLEMDGRTVAYKVMRPGRDLSPRLVAQFYREAAITDAVRQPGVVPIYAKVIDDSRRPAYAMEFLKGQTLADALKQVAPRDPADPPSGSPLDLIRRFLDACRVVGVAHERGIVHGDLNLRNIMLVAHWQAVRVVDWGSAVELATTESRPMTHAVAPIIRDPALAPGSAPARTSDVFALGVGLRELARALDATGASVVSGRLRRDSARALLAIARRATMPDPAARYPDAGELADDLGRFLAGGPARADREPWRERSWRWVARHRTGMTASVLGLISLTLLLAAWSQIRLKEQEERETRRLLVGSRAAALLETVNSIRREKDTELKLDDPILRQLAQTIGAGRDQARDDLALMAELIRGRNEQAAHDHIESREQHRDHLERQLDRGAGLLRELMTEYPDNEIYRFRLAEAYLQLAFARTERRVDQNQAQLLTQITRSLSNPGRTDLADPTYEAALRLLEKSGQLAEPLRGTPGSPVDPQSVLDLKSHIQFVRVVLLLLLGRYSEALEVDLGPATAATTLTTFIHQARPILIKAAEMEQQHLPWSRPPRIDHAKAARLAEFLAHQPAVSPAGIFNSACALALAGEDRAAPPIERERRARQAVILLQEIAGRGYFHRKSIFPLRFKDTIEELRTDSTLNPLRTRPDFRALVERFP